MVFTLVCPVQSFNASPACFICPDKRGQLAEVELRSAIDDLRLRFRSNVPKKPLGSDIFPNTYPTSQTPSPQAGRPFLSMGRTKTSINTSQPPKKLRINESDVIISIPTFLGKFSTLNGPGSLVLQTLLVF